MTLSKLMRDLGLDSAPYGYPTSAQKLYESMARCCAFLWLVARRISIETHLAHTVQIKVEAA